MKFDSKCHLSTKLFAEHSKIASQPINWKVNKCHFVVLVVNKCHFVVLVVRKRSRNDFTLLKRVLKLCNNVANYGTKKISHLYVAKVWKLFYLLQLFFYLLQVFFLPTVFSTSSKKIVAAVEVMLIVPTLQWSRCFAGKYRNGAVAIQFEPWQG